jgi:AbrB family looped-hinge helix DNA binding protein
MYGETMPKLLKHFAYSYRKRSGEEIPHYKYVVVIPEDARRKVNWRDGEELEFEVDGDRMTIMPKQNVETNRKKSKRAR